MSILKPSPSLVEQVKSQIKRRIINEEFEAGRIPSESDLANELGVSIKVTICNMTGVTVTLGTNRMT